MELWRAHLGPSGGYLSLLRSGEVSASDTGWDSETRHVELADGFRAVSHRDVIATPEPERGRFVLSDLGPRLRLAWPAGACEIDSARITYWRGELAFWREPARLIVADAGRDRLLAIELAEVFTRANLTVHGEAAWLYDDDTATRFAIAAIRALFDRPAGLLTATVRETYPFRRRDHVLPGWVYERSEDGAVITARGLRIRIPPTITGLRVDDKVRLRDRVWMGRYRAIDVDGEPLQAIEPDELPTESALTLVIEHVPAVDPLPPASTVVPAAARQDSFERLLVALADEPDELACRMVLVDALEEAGAPFAPAFRALLDGDVTEATRADALGRFAHYVDRIEYRCGLPCRGSIAATAPPDRDLARALADDVRLGLFETLRLGDAPSFELYNVFIASPRAVGLRHVDVPNQRVLAALRAANRANLRRISSVKFASRDTIVGLCDPLFDSVRELEIEATARSIAGQLATVRRDEHGFFARASRSLIATATDNSDDALVPRVLEAWNELPVTSVTVAGVTLFRDGTATLGRASAATETLVRRHFEIRADPRTAPRSPS